MRTGFLAFVALTGLISFGRSAGGAVNVTDIHVVQESGDPENGAIDPDEKVTLNITFTNVGPSPTTYAIATFGQNANVIPLSEPQVLGVMAVGASVTVPFQFVARGSCGEDFQIPVTITDGSATLGNTPIPMHFGASSTTTPAFSNILGIAVPSLGTATPYPSEIVVSGVEGVVEQVDVTLAGITHNNPDDLDVLLVAPDGTKIILMSDAGGALDCTNVILTFSDTTNIYLPDDSPLVSGTFHPSNWGSGDTFAAPAPAGPYSDDLSALAGKDPNGTWKLYVVDDNGGNAGAIGTWHLDIRNTRYTCAEVKTAPHVDPIRYAVVAESCGGGNGRVDANEMVTLDFTFRNVGNANAPNVTSTVEETPQVQVLSGVVATGALNVGAEDTARHQLIIREQSGSHVLVRLKLKSGTADIGTVTYTIVPGTPFVGSTLWRDFSNPMPIDIPTVGAAAPYPSSIYVTNVWGSVTNIHVDLEDLTHAYPDDIDILLVGPTGHTVMLLSDAGGAHPVSNKHMTFLDDADMAQPDDDWLLSGFCRPTDYGPPENLPAPAPAGPYGSTLSGFYGLEPNGPWKLYVRDDTTVFSGSLAKWSLTLYTDAHTWTFSSGPAAVPDNNIAEFPITVSDYGRVGRLRVYVRLNHTWDADMEMTLVGPDGTEAVLVMDRGGSGNNFGSGTNDCSGLPTLFSDSAVTPIANGVPPFAGPYLPEQPLSVFAGKPLRGTWKLRVRDDLAGMVGTLGCWKLDTERCYSAEIVKESTITIPSSGSANPYPSVIDASNVFGRVVGVTVRLNGVKHENADDLDILLSGPDGTAVYLMSDAGGNHAIDADYLVFDDSADSAPSNDNAIPSGYYHPANYRDPAEPAELLHTTELSAFNGIKATGDWKLHVVDDSAGHSGSIDSWTLTLHTLDYTSCTGAPYTEDDVKWAALIAGGRMEATQGAIDRLNVVDPPETPRVNLRDVTRLIRKVAGLEPNP